MIRYRDGALGKIISTVKLMGFEGKRQKPHSRMNRRELSVELFVLRRIQRTKVWVLLFRMIHVACSGLIAYEQRDIRPSRSFSVPLASCRSIVVANR